MKIYTGSTERKFKYRLYQHRANAKTISHRKKTKMAGYTWDKKDASIDIINVKWQILRKCQKYSANSRMFDVCLSKKLAIMEKKEHNSLNQRTELMNRIIHQSLKTLSSARRK